MSLEIPGRYLWDFWFARDGDIHHLFFLTAPKTEAHPDARHPDARIGHATSFNLVDWLYHGIVLGPSAEPAWDDGATWTGSVIRRHDGKWMMFYTGTRRSDQRKIQRIGAALSDDLFTWTKIENNPLLAINGEYYETYDPARWHDEAFRDPWVYADPDGDGWRMLITARAKDGLAKGAGVIGQAKSRDLMSWKVGEPVYRGSYYGEMEVPQLFQFDGWWYCLFSNASRHMEPNYVASGKPGIVTGTHYLRSRSSQGPFELTEDRFFAGDETGHFYGGKVVEAVDGNLMFMAFLNHRDDGSFVGALSDPLPVWTNPKGFLRIDARKYGLPLRP
jgi:beta-fructofuranosidase